MPITKELCSRLKKGGYPTCDRPKYPPDRECKEEECDIVSFLPNNKEVWIEAKRYYTFWFPPGKGITAAKGDDVWRKKIMSLIRDCRDKLCRRAPHDQYVAGLLLGFEITNPGKRHKSSGDIDRSLVEEMREKENLPDWELRKLLSSELLPETCC